MVLYLLFTRIKRKNDLLRKLERVLIMKKNVTVLQNNEVKMYEAPPDEKDVYIERLKKQGYNRSIFILIVSILVSIWQKVKV